MASRSKSLAKIQESLLINDCDDSKIHRRLDNYEKIGNSNLISSRLEMSSSRISNGLIKVQESFNISEIYKEVELDKENMLLDFENTKDNQDSRDFCKFLEENTGMGLRQKTFSKLDESSIVGEGCRVIVPDPDTKILSALKEQQSKYYKAFMIMQASFVSTKESNDRKLKSLVSQLSEVNQLIKENKEYKLRLEAAVSSKIDVIKEELLQKFKENAGRIIEKYRSRENELKNDTKNKIILIRKGIDDGCDRGEENKMLRARNSEELLRKNCKMRLKLALMQDDSENC